MTDRTTQSPGEGNTERSANLWTDLSVVTVGMLSRALLPLYSAVLLFAGWAWYAHGQFGKIDSRFTAVEVKLDGVIVRLDKMDDRFDKMDARFDKMEEKMDARFDKMDARFNKFEEKMDRLLESKR